MKGFQLIMFCIHCGEKNKDIAKFCMNCGQELSVTRSYSYNSNNSAKTNIKRATLASTNKSSFMNFYFSVKGRISRKEFFFKGIIPASLMAVILLLGANFISLQEASKAHAFTNLLIVLISIVVTVAQFTVSIKRLHDFDANGWWSIGLFIPIVNFIILMLLFFKRPNNKENKYGDKPDTYVLTHFKWFIFIISLLLIWAVIVTNGLLTHMEKGQDTQKTNEVEHFKPTIKGVERVFIMILNGKYGFVDINGDWIVAPIYDYANDFDEGLSVVEVNDGTNQKYGLIDKKGNLIAKPTYNQLEISGDVVHFELNDKWGVMDKKGRILIQPIYNYLSFVAFKKGLMKFTLNRKDGFIDQKGNVIVQPIYEKVWDFSEGVAAVQQNGKLGFIDQKGNVIAQPIYEEVGHFSEGLAAVKQNGKYGFIDQKGNVIVQPIYEKVWDFSEGVAAVKQNGKSGFIDQKGNVIVQLR